MSTSLLGLQIGSSYSGLLKTSDNLVLSGSLRTVTDGQGNDSALQVSTAGVKSTGTLDVVGAATVGGTMGITGATTVGGTLGVTGATTLGAAALGGTVTGAGIAAYLTAALTAPGPIGSVTPSTGAFTTLSATTPVPLASGGTSAATPVLARAALNKGETAITDAATIATDASLGNVFTVTLGGNRTLGAPTNLAAGATYIWRFTQDGTGSRTLAYNAVFKFPGGTAPVLTTTAGGVDIISGVSNGTNLYCSFLPNLS